MDTIADMGGMQGYGPVQLDPPDDPPFHEEWERRAFAMALLAMRTSGTNLDTFRYALERQHPLDYLPRRLLRALAQVRREPARGQRHHRPRRGRGPGPQAGRGEDVEEPPPTRAEQARLQADGRRLRPPDRHAAEVRSGRPGAGQARLHPPGHTRLARYIRGRAGVVRIIQPAQVLPDTNAHFLGENAQHVYNVSFDSHELWGAGRRAVRAAVRHVRGLPGAGRS